MMTKTKKQDEALKKFLRRFDWLWENNTPLATRQREN